MKKDIVIMGAGPAGLMAALKLAERGLKPTVIEMKNNMDKLNRACSMQFIIDDEYEADVLKVEGQKPVFTKCGLEVPYTGKLVPLYNKYYHSPKDHIIHFTRNNGKDPFSYKFDKQFLLKNLFEACAAKGVEFMMGTLVLGGKDKGNGVELTVRQKGERLTLTCDKLIIAEGVNASVCGKFGLNKQRMGQAGDKVLDLGMAYSMKYLMEGITGVENNSWNLYYGNAYHSKTACIIGPSLEGDGIFEVTITGSPGLMPKKIFEEFTTASPMAKHFKNAKLLKKNGCGLKPFMAMKEPCRGNIMAIGDCAAHIEVINQGAMMCGYHAGHAVADELDGRNGFEAYAKWWNGAFEFNCEDPMEQLKLYGALSIKRTLADDEIDYLFSMLADEKHCGHFNQYEVPKNFWTDVLKHDAEIRKDRPALYDKLAAIRTYKEQGKF